jgi:hypothetical protein
MAFVPGAGSVEEGEPLAPGFAGARGHSLVTNPALFASGRGFSSHTSILPI